MHKALHPRDDVDRLYVYGGRGLTSTEDSIDASIQRLENFIKKRGGKRISATRNNTDNTNISRTKINKETKMTRKTTVWIYQATNKRNLT